MTIYSSHIVNQIFCKLSNNFLTLLTKETWSKAPEKLFFLLLTVKSPDHESSLTLIFSIQHKIAAVPEFPSTLKTIALMRLIVLIFFDQLCFKSKLLYIFHDNVYFHCSFKSQMFFLTNENVHHNALSLWVSLTQTIHLLLLCFLSYFV